MQIAARPEADLATVSATEPAVKGKSPRRSLQRNFLAITLSSVLAILLVSFAYLENSNYRSASRQIDEKIYRMIDGGSILLADATARQDTDELLLLLVPVLGDPDVVSVAITLANGAKLAEHGEPMASIPAHRVFHRTIMHVMNGEPTQIGRVTVGITHRRIDEELRSRLWTDIALAMLILIAIVVSSFLSLRMTVMRPMRALLSAIEGWEVDDDPRPVNWRRNDEFGQLISAFNQMQSRQQYYQNSLRAALDSAESADQAKTAFLAIIGHELRTPLNAIIGFSDLIKHKMGDDPDGEYSTYLGHINDSGNALLDMINDILDITHAQAGRLEPADEPVLLRDLAEQIIERCVHKAGGDIAAVQNDVPGSLPEIRIDPVRLGRMIFHLITNAIRFTPPDGHIRIHADLGDDGFRVGITDTGCGIPEDRLADLQQPFAQLSTDWTHHSEGAGLGLAYVRQMAQRLGGTFVLESAAGKGTTAMVTLPVSPPQ
ncbi:MAG: HAMP domain-containing histidine kinase [Rhodospirillaceae bacterium]|nr:HAMP domain-containing histidine kinase [Rhodospirillaceae bacterium]